MIIKKNKKQKAFHRGRASRGDELYDAYMRGEDVTQYIKKPKKKKKRKKR